MSLYDGIDYRLSASEVTDTIVSARTPVIVAFSGALNGLESCDNLVFTVKAYSDNERVSYAFESVTTKGASSSAKWPKGDRGADNAEG